MLIIPFIFDSFESLYLYLKKVYGTRPFSFEISKLQLQKLINGKVVKIRVVDDLTNRHDAEVKNNQFSSIISKELKLVEDRLKNNDDTEGF